MTDEASLTQRVTWNALTATIARIGGSLIALFNVALIARGLGIDGYGQYTTVIAYLSTAGILADLGLYTLMTREISLPGANEKEIASDFFTLRLILAVFFLALAVGAVSFFPYAPIVKVGIVLTSVAYLFLSLCQILMGIFQKYLQLQWTAIAEIAGRIGQLLLTVLFFVKGAGLLSYLSGVIVGACIMLILNILFAYKLIPFHLHISLRSFRRIVRTTLPIAVSLIFVLLYFKSDMLLLSIMKTEYEVGIYGIAYKVLEAIIFFPAMFVGIMMPLLSRTATESREDFSRIFQKVFDILSVTGFPFVVGGILVSSSFVQIIAGHGFSAATAPMQILFIAIGIIFYGSLASNAVIALNLQKKAMWIYGVGMVFNVGANLFVIPRYSYIGASWTTVLTEFFVTLALFWLIHKKTNVWPRFGVSLRAGAAALLMGILAYVLVRPIGTPLPPLHFLVVIAVCVALYGVCAILLRAVSRNDIKLIMPNIPFLR